MALQPVVSLLWQQKIGFFKLNWLLYPFILLAIAGSMAITKKAPKTMLALIGIMAFYSLYFTGSITDWESIFRIFIDLLPLTFFLVFLENDDGSDVRTFWTLYFLAMAVPILLSGLQLMDIVPYYNFDSVDGGVQGRISGGYNKPNNFVAFLFPLFLFGFHRWKVQGRRLQGLLLIAMVLCMVYLTGLRTAVAIFFLILACAFFIRDISSQAVYAYYKYYLNFFIGVLSFVSFYVLFNTIGLVDGIRGRVPMWLAHSNQFFNSSWAEVLLGRGHVQLPAHYASNLLIGTLDEVHNNTFRTIITFGLIGYLLYCLFMRWIAMRIFQSTEDGTIRFIKLSCFLFLMLYSTTNEPAYYSSILWSVLLGTFPVWGESERSRVTSTDA